MLLSPADGHAHLQTPLSPGKQTYTAIENNWVRCYPPAIQHWSTIWQIPNQQRFFGTIWGCSLAMFGAGPEMGVSRNGGNPKWINGWFIYVSSLENPIKVKMDDLGLSLF